MKENNGIENNLNEMLKNKKSKTKTRKTCIHAFKTSNSKPVKFKNVFKVVRLTVDVLIVIFYAEHGLAAVAAWRL